MSRLGKFASKDVAESTEFQSQAVENFMGGTSYKVSPLSTLKIIAASSIFGESQYYKAGIGVPKQSKIRNYSEFLPEYLFKHSNESAADTFTKAIDAALTYDFKATLDLALELRTDYFMRLNPAVIFVRAAAHKNREAFNKSLPGYMRKIGKSIALRPDDITNQFEYYMYANGTKKNLPSLLKRTWSDSLEAFSRYQLNKYKGKSLIDLVRISHANSETINELMKTGTIQVQDSELTWEILRSAGKTWREIDSTIKIPHMALLRNLKNIFTEVNDLEFAKSVLDKLRAGVKNGKQFPFRYHSAYKVIEKETVNHKGLILDALEDCMDISVSNVPKLKGKTMCLSDNSGSAWGTLTSEYGTSHVAEIGNLSSLITAMQSDEGEIGLFGDKLIVLPVSKRNGLLKQAQDANKVEKIDKKLGGGTENGIWLFFNDAIKNKKHYDNIFIYSDMQAGTGNLYGLNYMDYAEFGCKFNTRMIDVLGLVRKYRATVNKKVNIFCVQTAGYDNTVVPEQIYRGSLLTGWTGKEAQYAKSIIDIWNEIECK